MSNTDDIREFMTVGEHPVRDVPTIDIPDWERVLRAKLVLSEAIEFVEAMGCQVVYRDDTDGVESFCTGVGKQIFALDNSHASLDLVEAADACADLRYVVIGSEITLGIPGDAVFDEVHRSNMSKFVKRDDGGFDVLFDADRKVVKPPTYSPPNIAAVLKEAGWEG